jgi:hypothetical protein
MTRYPWSDMTTELPRATLANRRVGFSIPVLFVLVWVAYAILVGGRDDGVFGPYHNDVFWPAETYLTSAQPGWWLKIFAHVMISLVGGAFLLVAVIGLLRLVKRPALATKICPILFLLLFVYSFLFVRAIPEQVTVVDSDAHELRVRTFARFALWPDSSRVIAGREVQSVGAKVEQYSSRRDSDDVLRIYAWVGADKELVYLGLRECPDARDVCISAGDDAIKALVRDLGREISTIKTNNRATVRAFVLR